MEYDIKELKLAVRSLNKAKITTNRIKLSGGRLLETFLDEMDLIIDSGLSSNVPDDVVDFYESLDNGNEEEVEEEIEQEEAEIEQEEEMETEELEDEPESELEEDEPEEEDMEIEQAIEEPESIAEEPVEEPVESESPEESLNLDDPDIWHTDDPLPDKEEEVLIRQVKEIRDISFDKNNKPVLETMSVFANVMDIYIDNPEVDVVLLIQILRSRGIETTERYARVRLKHSKDMYALMESKGLLK